MPLTLYDGLVALRDRVNDSGDGQWSSAVKQRALNASLRRTLVRTRSYQGTASLALVAETHTYDASPVFEPKAVRIGDNRLTVLPIGSLAAIEENWDALPSAQPTRCVPIGGGRLRLSPAPSAAWAGVISSVEATPTAAGTGYSVNDVLTITTGGSGGKVKVTAIGGGGTVTTVVLNSSTDSQGRTKYDRGTGYTAAAGKATTASPAGGTGCTIEIATLAKLEVYGPATISPLGAGRISTVAAAPTAGGTGYTVNDVLYVTTGGTKGTVRVTGVTAGVVTAIELVSAGVDYTTGTAKATAGGTGSGCTIQITAVTDGTYLPIDELAEAAEEAWLLGAEELLWASRPNMPGAAEARKIAHDLWAAECEAIKVSLGLP